MKTLKWDFPLLYSGLESTKIIFIIININILRETNSIYVYSINVWWTENRKKHNANLVERAKCTSAFGRTTVSMRESKIQGQSPLGLLLTLGLYNYHMFITVNITHQIR